MERKKARNDVKQLFDEVFVIFTIINVEVFLCVKNQISPFATLLSGTEGPAQNRHGSNIVQTLLIRFFAGSG